jgi:hypothetical protein
MSGGETFRRAKRSWSQRALFLGQRVRVLKGPFAQMTGSAVKNCGDGRWALKLDGLHDGLYVILTDDLFATNDAPNKPPDKPHGHAGDKP